MITTVAVKTTRGMKAKKKCFACDYNSMKTRMRVRLLRKMPQQQLTLLLTVFQVLWIHSNALSSLHCQFFPIFFFNNVTSFQLK